jgi:hypothetical protein
MADRAAITSSSPSFQSACVCMAVLLVGCLRRLIIIDLH